MAIFPPLVGLMTGRLADEIQMQFSKIIRFSTDYRIYIDAMLL